MRLANANTRFGRGLFNLVAMSLGFSTYFCMYAFRKPFAAGAYEDSGWLGLDLKTVFVISQVLGYTCSKYLGIKVMSEARRRARFAILVSLIGAAEVALLLFAVLPQGGKVVSIFLNGLPLGMVWGLVVRYLEGRRSSDVLLAGLSCSFIVASGVVKDIGRYLMASWSVPEYWMPAATGALFLVPFSVSAWFLDRLPEPDSDDRLARTERKPMASGERWDFLKRFLPGMVLLLIVYLALTAFRDFRDNYGVELFRELGYGDEPAIFTRTELPVALVVLVSLASLAWVQDRRRGLLAVFLVMTAGLALLVLGTLLLDAKLIDGALWMTLIGLGAYLAYVPFSSFLFDRLMAATRYAGTAVFAVALADAIGYTGSVTMQLFKDLVATGSTRLEFFRELTYGLGSVGAGLLVLSMVYFFHQMRIQDGASRSDHPSLPKTKPQVD